MRCDLFKKDGGKKHRQIDLMIRFDCYIVQRYLNLINVLRRVGSFEER